MSGYLKYKKRILELIKPKVWILEGNEKSTTKPLKIFYIGKENTKEYIRKITFEDHCREEYLGKKLFLSIIYLLEMNRYKCSLAIIEGKTIEQYLYGAVKDFSVPLWVDTFASLPLVATNKDAKNEIRRVRKNKLEYIVTRDEDLLHDFYYNMYLPMTHSRHKTGAVEYTYEEVVEMMKKECYELLLIKKQNTILSGGLIYKCEKVPRFWINGIRDSKYMKEGAIGAAYIYAAKHYAEQGYEKVSFGGARAFLNDGVLHYKKKWNITLSMSQTTREKGYILKSLIMSDGLKGFFENNPFVYRIKDRLYGAIFIDENKECREDDYKKLQKKYLFDGLSDMNVYSISENKIIHRTDCEKKFNDKIER